MGERDRDVTPGEAQNTGPAHRTPPGPPERRHGALRPDEPEVAEPPGGEPDIADDR